MDCLALIREGSCMDAAAIAELARVLAADPTKLDIRARLIGFHARTRNPGADPEALGRHVLWVIRNAPTSDLAHAIGGVFRRDAAPEAYEQARSLWLEHVRQQPDHPVMLDHATHFLRFDDPETAIKLIERVRALEPDQLEWILELARLHGSRRWELAGEERIAAARRSHAEWQRALAIIGHKYKETRVDLLQDAAWMAFEAGADELARAHAEELLAIAPAHPRSWWHGNAVHKANLVLGRLALRHGDLDLAKEHLLAAARIKGSPQLNSFGPNMTLAMELLLAGEKSVVLEYLRLCRAFWECGQERLDRWIAEIEAGTEPEFGPNLAY